MRNDAGSSSGGDQGLSHIGEACLAGIITQTIRALGAITISDANTSGVGENTTVDR